MNQPTPERERPAAWTFRLELIDPAARLVRDEPLGPCDFQSAVLAAHFSALRKGLVAEYCPELDTARIEPRFAGDNGSTPYAVGFRVSSPLGPRGEYSAEFGIGYFTSRVKRTRIELVRGKRLDALGELRYRLAAYLDDGPAAEKPPGSISLDRSTCRIPIVDRRRAELGEAAAWDEPDPADPPVLIAGSVLAEAVDEARRAPDREIGGVLLGNLCRDEESGRLFVHITGLASGGQSVVSTEASVTFTPETWQLAREMIALRGAGEAIIGWHHSHPFRLCEQCAQPAPAECVNKILFYSLDDVQLMETWFAQPYMVGLLSAADTRLERSLDHLPVRLFGWRGGQIVARGFDVLGS